MSHPKAGAHESYPDPHHDVYSRTTFGFWIYLLTDFVLFGTIFATYVVLQNSTFGGPNAKALFHLPFNLVETIVLLISSFTVGLAGTTVHQKNKNRTLILFGVTFVLGVVFFSMQMSEFSRLVQEGDGWQKSAFLSAYFTLVGTHALHIVFALLWTIVLIVPLFRQEIDHVSIRRLTCLKMFWQFLNIVWIFIFSFVYLMGVK